MPEKRPHAFDGIEEYDNPLPRWWVWLFYGCIAYAVGYWILMPSWFGPGVLKWSQKKAYAQELAAAPKPKAGAGAQEVLAAIDNEHEVLEGKAIFSRNCAACHGQHAEGMIGPSLVKPPYWAFGTGEPADIVHIVSEGTPKGMPTWKNQLKPHEIAEVAAFVHGLSHPSDPHRQTI